MINKEFNDLLNRYHDNHLQRYFNLKELMPITGMKDRQIKKQVKIISQRYQGATNLIEKAGREWKIHYSIVDVFMPKKRRQETLYNQHWNTFLTINPMTNGNRLKLFDEFIREFNSLFPSSYSYSAIESSYSNKLHNQHIHIVSTMASDEIVAKTNDLIELYFGKAVVRYESVMNRYMSLQYLKKANHLLGQKYYKPTKHV